MSFESGSVSFRAFRAPAPMPENALAYFAENVIPAFDTIKNPVTGWVSGRNVLNRILTEESAFYGGYLRLDLLTAERKPSAALLKAEIAMECRAALEAEGKPFLNSTQRAEIRKSVFERLQATAPLSLRAIPMVWNTNGETMYAQALSVSASDRLNACLVSTIVRLDLSARTVLPAPLTPHIAAQLLFNVESYDLAPVSFSPDIPSSEGEVDLGCEFLTWLWYQAEAGETSMALIEGPLTFINPYSQGSEITTLRKGLPTHSYEACACLKAGKKLKSAKLTLVDAEGAFYPFTLDAQEFTFRGLKLPVDAVKFDAVSRFQERLRKLETFTDLFYGLYQEFLKLRTHASDWAVTVQKMQQWVAGRRGRG